MGLQESICAGGLLCSAGRSIPVACSSKRHMQPGSQREAYDLALPVARCQGQRASRDSGMTCHSIQATEKTLTETGRNEMNDEARTAENTEQQCRGLVSQ